MNLNKTLDIVEIFPGNKNNSSILALNTSE